eukprot:15473009-Alexandrium_andersonii.AAC.1
MSTQRLSTEAGLLDRPQSIQPTTEHARATWQRRCMLRRAAYVRNRPASRTERPTSARHPPRSLGRRARRQGRAADGEPDQGERDREDPVEGEGRLGSRGS